MKIAIDTETEAITPTSPAPRLVCLSYADGQNADLLKYEDAEALLDVAVHADRIVGHNFAFDACVLLEHMPERAEQIFGLYEQGRISDTLIREALARISRGTLDTEGPLNLGYLAGKYLGVALDKGEDSWRTRYGELRETPLDQWPERARAYPIADATSTLGLHDRQKDRPDEVLQTRADFALRLMAVHGVVTDEAAVDDFEIGLLERVLEHREDLTVLGLLKTGRKKVDRACDALRESVRRKDKRPALAELAEVRADILRHSGAYDLSRDMRLTKSMIVETLGAGRTPLTPTGQVQTSEEVLEATKRPELLALAEYNHTAKLLDTYVPVVRAGTEHPIHSSYRVLVASGRTSCSGPNWQNLPRAPGARECVVPRPGRVFVAADYEVAELRALAQVCYSWLGFSALREAFIAGRDPHLELAATLLGISYADARAGKKAHDPKITEARQFAKIPNFGFPGGLGAEAFSSYAKGFGHNISEERARELKAAWSQQWPEMAPYFRTVGQVTGDLGEKSLVQYGSGRVRGGLSFTQAANTMFQGLVADFAKDALWEVTRRAYTVPSSKLYGSRPVIFVHDEIILEADEDRAADAAEELVSVMEEIEGKWLADIPPAAEAKLMRRWSKKAEPVRRDGVLICWEDR